MKKRIPLLLALLLAFQLCACGQLEKLKEVELPPLPQVTQRPESGTEAPAVTAEQPADAQTPAPVEPEDSETARTGVIVSFRKTEQNENDPATGEQRILSFSYVSPLVAIPGREAAAETINEYLAMLDETFYTGNDYGDGPASGFNGMLELALDNFTYVYESGTELPLEFSCTRDASVLRADGRVLSLEFGTYTYSGGAHGSYVNRAYVFDTETGELLTLDRLTADPAALQAFLVSRMVEMVRTDEELNAAIAPYLEESAWETSLGALLREGSWYLDNEGLVLFSDQYELSAYAAGTQSFRFSYEELGDLIDAKWRVGARTGSGSFIVLGMDEVENGSFPILDILSLDENGAQICLVSGERNYDVMISRAGYSEDAGWFTVGDPLWYCSCMEASGVQLTAIIPDGFPNLALSYRGEGGETHHCLISQSGEDGSYLLLEEGVSFSPYD